MTFVFLRGKNKLFSISSQQKFIIDYANKNKIAIFDTEIDNSHSSLSLEDRQVLLQLLKSLNKGDTILIYDLWVLSQKVGELTKVFDCVFKHDIVVHVCKKNLMVDSNIPVNVLINHLSIQREENLIKQKNSLGRPKGSFSRSKFDIHKSDIVKMICDNYSVSEIAKRLGVSRSSLKDYINSRSLKEIAFLKYEHNADKGEYNNVLNLPSSHKCPLIDKKNIEG